MRSGDNMGASIICLPSTVPASSKPPGFCIPLLPLKGGADARSASVGVSARGPPPVAFGDILPLSGGGLDDRPRRAAPRLAERRGQRGGETFLLVGAQKIGDRQAAAV